VYRQRRDPSMPEKTTNYIITLTELVEENEDLEVNHDEELRALTSLPVDLDLDPLAVTTTAAAQSLLTLKLSAESAAPNYHGDQEWTLAMEEQNVSKI
jgi:hypothetical protein